MIYEMRLEIWLGYMDSWRSTNFRGIDIDRENVMIFFSEISIFTLGKNLIWPFFMFKDNIISPLPIYKIYADGKYSYRPVFGRKIVSKYI